MALYISVAFKTDLHYGFVVVTNAVHGRIGTGQDTYTEGHGKGQPEAQQGSLT